MIRLLTTDYRLQYTVYSFFVIIYKSFLLLLHEPVLKPTERYLFREHNISFKNALQLSLPNIFFKGLRTIKNKYLHWKDSLPKTPSKRSKTTMLHLKRTLSHAVETCAETAVPEQYNPTVITTRRRARATAYSWCV